MAKTAKLSLKKNMVVFAIGVFFTKIISFVFAPIYSRFMTTADFGVADILTTTCSLALPIFTLAITEAVIKFGIDDNGDLKKTFSTGLAVTAVGMVGITLFVILAGQFIYTGYLWMTLCYFLGECVFLFLQAFAQAQKNTTAYVLSSVVYSVVSAGMILLLIIPNDFGVNGFMAGMALGTVVASVLLIIMCKTWRFFSPTAIDKATVAKMIRYSAPLAVSNVGYWVISGSDKYITNILLGDEYNGYLSVIHKIPTLCTLLFSIFNYAYTLSALKDHQLSEESKEEDTVFYSKLFEYVTLLLVFGSLAVALFSQPIVMLYSSAYRNYWIYIPLYTFGVILGSFRSFYTSIYCVKEKTLKIMIIVFIGAAINILACYLLMKFAGWELWATAASTIAANGFIFLFYYIDSRKYVRIRLNWREVVGLLSCLGVSILPRFVNNPVVYYPVTGGVTLLLLLINLKTIKQLALDIFHRNKPTVKEGESDQQ